MCESCLLDQILIFVSHSEILEGLKKVGYKTNLGLNNTGMLHNVLERGGGYYLGWHLCRICVGTSID